MTPTHKRRARHAEALQFNDANIQDVLAKLHQTEGCTAEPYKGNTGMILVRNTISDGMNPGIYTLYVGDWLVTGENGEMKHYSDYQFKIKYETL